MSPDREPRCADAADSRDDPRAGTASPVSRWLLVEQPGPWGRDALTRSRLDAEVAAELAQRSRRTGVRVLLVRRHGRPGHSPQGRRHWALADSRPGRSGIRWGRFDSDDELLDLDLTGPLPTDEDAAPPHDPTRPVYLVCAHGRHDTCCAVRGRTLAAALETVVPGRVWECSHVGGCRFAANLVVLPHGLYYGGVTPTTAPDVVEATEAGLLLPALLRGRSSLPGAVQAAEHHARAALARTAPEATDAGGPHGIDALRTMTSSTLEDGSVAVELTHPGTGRVLVATVRQVPTGPSTRLTCAAARTAVPLGWQLMALTESTATRS